MVYRKTAEQKEELFATQSHEVIFIHSAAPAQLSMSENSLKNNFPLGESKNKRKNFLEYCKNFIFILCGRSLEKFAGKLSKA